MSYKMSYICCSTHLCCIIYFIFTIQAYCEQMKMISIFRNGLVSVRIRGANNANILNCAQLQQATMFRITFSINLAAQLHCTSCVSFLSPCITTLLHVSLHQVVSEGHNTCIFPPSSCQCQTFWICRLNAHWRTTVGMQNIIVKCG